MAGGKSGVILPALGIVGGVLSFYSVLVKTAGSDSAFYLLLLVLGVIGVFRLVSYAPSRNSKLVVVGLGVVSFFVAAYFAWERGNFHKAIEQISCDLTLPFCTEARLLRVTHAFRPLVFTGFNAAFDEKKIDEQHAYCRSGKATKHLRAEVAYFTLTRQEDLEDELLVFWDVKSLSREWDLAMVISIGIDEEVRAFPGYLQQDLITLEETRFPPKSTELQVRICGKPGKRRHIAARTAGISDLDRGFWRFVDLERIDVVTK